MGSRRIYSTVAVWLRGDVMTITGMWSSPPTSSLRRNNRSQNSWKMDFP